MADQSTRRRVKLYALNAERQWDDRGTGHVTSSYVEKLQGVSLLVKAESDGNILLESKIHPETIYQKQQETLIVWSEGDNFDLALSFQERAGCDEIWEKICQVQGRDPSVEITQEVVEESEDERFDDMSDTVPSIELPAAEMGRLEEISELINGCLHSAIKREKLTLAVEADNYIPKLMRMFQMCEDLENTAGLHHLHDIIINLFQLNKNALIESMFKIDVIFDVVGCLEYDPANPVPTRHREYLRQMANFKQVLPIRNSELLAKIHQTYRVQYIQDIVLPTPTMFEDNVLSTLSSFIFFNKLDIVRQLQDDEKFLTEFFALLSDEKTAITKRRDLVLFLKEFCTFSHTLQPQSKETFFKTLLSLGVLQALETTLTVDAGDLSQPGQVIKAACIDILMYIVETVPSMVREHMLQQAETCDDDQLLMNLIVEQMVCDRDPEVGSAVQLSGIIRILIDPDNMMAALNRSEKTEFFAFFYKHCMHSLVAPLLSNTTDDSPLHDDPATVQLLNLVLELLSFCVEHHTFHAKNFIITRNMVARILVLMKSKHKYLVLDALRFLRKMVALKDENYNRHIVKQNLFAPVVEAFFHNQGRYNLLDSAVIELFEFIKTEDIKTLLAYIVETFGDKLLDVTYVQTFRNLKQRYEQQQDRLQQRTTALESVPSILRGTTRYRRDPRQMEEDEEMWFNDDDDYEDGVEPAPVTGLHSTAAVSDLEQIGKMMEGRNKLFSPSAADLTEKAGAEPACGVNGPATAAAAAAAAKLAPVAAAPALTNDAVSMVKKVGLVDYDADSDEEDEEAGDAEHLSPLSMSHVAGQLQPLVTNSAAQQPTPAARPAAAANSQQAVTSDQPETGAEPAQSPPQAGVDNQHETGSSPAQQRSVAADQPESCPPGPKATAPSERELDAAGAAQEACPPAQEQAGSSDQQETGAPAQQATAPVQQSAVSADQQQVASPTEDAGLSTQKDPPAQQDTGDSIRKEASATQQEVLPTKQEACSSTEKESAGIQNGSALTEDEPPCAQQEVSVSQQELCSSSQQESCPPDQQESQPMPQKSSPAKPESPAAQPDSCSSEEEPTVPAPEAPVEDPQPTSAQEEPAATSQPQSAPPDPPAGPPQLPQLPTSPNPQQPSSLGPPASSSPGGQQPPPPAAEVAVAPPRGQQGSPPAADEHRDPGELPSAKRPRLDAS